MHCSMGCLHGPVPMRFRHALISHVGLVISKRSLLGYGKHVKFLFEVSAMLV